LPTPGQGIAAEKELGAVGRDGAVLEQQSESLDLDLAWTKSTTQPGVFVAVSGTNGAMQE